MFSLTNFPNGIPGFGIGSFKEIWNLIMTIWNVGKLPQSEIRIHLTIQCCHFGKDNTIVVAACGLHK